MSNGDRTGGNSAFPFEAQFNHYAMLAQTTLEWVNDLVALHMELGRNTLKESSEGQKTLFSATDVNQYLTSASLLAREHWRRNVTYTCDVARIMTRSYAQQAN